MYKVNESSPWYSQFRFLMFLNRCCTWCFTRRSIIVWSLQPLWAMAMCSWPRSCLHRKTKKRSERPGCYPLCISQIVSRKSCCHVLAMICADDFIETKQEDKNHMYSHCPIQNHRITEALHTGGSPLRRSACWCVLVRSSPKHRNHFGLGCWVECVTKTYQVSQVHSNVWHCMQLCWI